MTTPGADESRAPDAPAGDDTAAEAAPESIRDAFAPRRLVVQLLGFAFGLVLLAWCIHGAWPRTDEDRASWERLLDADPLLVAAMIGCTLVSVSANGAIFWVSIRPVKTPRPLRMLDLQLVNLASNLLNYAPVRLGAIVRVIHHVRVDGLGVVQVGAWFAVIAYVLVLAVGSAFLATLARGGLDLVWVLLVAVQMTIGMLLLRAAAGWGLLQRFGQGMDAILGSGRTLAALALLRVVDLAAYAARLAVGATILGIGFRSDQVILLGLVAIGAGLIPFGRLGIREWSMAQAAALLALDQEAAESSLNQLALLDSAAEAIVFIPLGAIALLWMRGQWTTRRPAAGGDEGAGSSADAASDAGDRRPSSPTD